MKLNLTIIVGSTTAAFTASVLLSFFVSLLFIIPALLSVFVAQDLIQAYNEDKRLREQGVTRVVTTYHFNLGAK